VPTVVTLPFTESSGIEESREWSQSSHTRTSPFGKDARIPPPTLSNLPAEYLHRRRCRSWRKTMVEFATTNDAAVIQFKQRTERNKIPGSNNSDRSVVSLLSATSLPINLWLRRGVEVTLAVQDERLRTLVHVAERWVRTIPSDSSVSNDGRSGTHLTGFIEMMRRFSFPAGMVKRQYFKTSP
jgi:hypothetical protein